MARWFERDKGREEHEDVTELDILKAVWGIGAQTTQPVDIPSNVQTDIYQTGRRQMPPRSSRPR